MLVETGPTTRTTGTTATTPAHAELVARAASLRDDLRNNAAEADRERRLTDRAVAAVTGSGLMRLMTPKRHGGHGAEVRTLLEVAATLGEGCCSAAWTTGVLNVGNYVVSLFPEQAQREVWGTDPDARTALVLGRPNPGVEETEGGVYITGKWPYVSGCLHADRVGALVLRPGGEGRPSAPYFALMPMADVTVEDTWHIVGMRGTGSNTVVADRLFVPEHRLLPYQPVLRGETDGVVDPANRYRNSLVGIFSIGLLGSLLGGARAAFDLVQEKAGSRPVAGSTYKSQAESPSLQLDLATAASKIDTAWLLATRIAETTEQFAAAGENADTLTRSRARMDSTRAAQLCREAVDLLVTAHGSASFAEVNPLQRIWRDVHVGSRHAGFGMGIPEQLYGRALVGGDPREISLLV
ncbi:acyl-CoA dehydrogenase [Streptomyces triticagri]|uniref:Acyl-CoA dehydrogenase n=1 Tax=Streptomyces triticagri TaxID=2293568 RepID=A0A372M8N0_9ACTN|nr:acyl-CoA dehydrogenase family protein [Streptomyces triticagri]RFU86793.1 acyl-CoA dehydrogenase [Streptomyces triticagri]